MNYNNFKSQCETFLPTVGCININVDNYLAVSARLIYRCTFTYNGESYTIRCNSLGQWSLLRNNDNKELATIGHIYIEALWERSKL